jgi:hypothetical protein
MMLGPLLHAYTPKLYLDLIHRRQFKSCFRDFFQVLDITGHFSDLESQRPTKTDVFHSNFTH